MTKLNGSSKASTKEAHRSNRGVLDDLPKRIIDDSANTVTEICQECGMSRAWAIAFAAENVRTKRWERVYKRIGERIVPAYRKAA